MDELPQIIWNILIKGNMSVVGPRPIPGLRGIDRYMRAIVRYIKPENDSKWGFIT